ncbi:Mediator of DNA damage checkpoint protein 1 [Anthophora plagiata]
MNENQHGRKIHKDLTVSKIHAEIEATSRETPAWICDLNSSNKTKLNNSFLRPGRCYELKDGNMLQFGTVQAVYKVLRDMDESLIPETPMINNKKQQLIIPGTPDSSLNNSSTLGENVSMIPGTQPDHNGSVFQYPTLPLKMSTKSNWKNCIQDSSVNDSMDNSRSFNANGEISVSEQKLTIHDMETQKLFKSYNETDDDIHDMETQKICVTRKIRALTNLSNQQKVSIHDMETQQEIDISDMKTPKKISVQDDSNHDIEKPGTSEIKQQEKSCKKEQNNAKGNENSRSSNDLEKDGDVDVTGVPNGSQEWLQLSLTTNVEDEPSELDKSRNLLASQNLLNDFISDDRSSDEMRSKSPTIVKTLHANSVDEEIEKSIEDENIFEAATQINNINGSASKSATQRVSYTFDASLIANDSDETDDESAFLQSYSRKMTQSQTCDSEGSSTDEEGRFTEIALKQKRASCSFELRCNISRGSKNDANSSKDSDDPFDALTQPINFNRNSFAKQDKEDTINMNLNTSKSLKNDTERNEDRETEEAIDMAPTQIRSTEPSAMESRSSVNVTKNKTGSDEEDITEMEDNTPTQIISPQEKALDSGKDESSIPSHPLKPNLVEECSVEDIDYETAPTQLICEIRGRKSVSTSNTDKSKKSEVPRKVNLNDTLEKNMNALFQDVNEESIEEQPQISTQILENILQSSQSEDNLSARNRKSGVDNGSPLNKEAKQSIERRSRNLSSMESTSSSVSNKKSRRFVFDADTNSQNTENYFSTLTSKRKHNILADSISPADIVEHTFNKIKEREETSESVSTTNEKGSSISKTPSRSVSEDPSTPRSAPRKPSTPKSSRKYKNSESKIPERILEKVNASTSNKDVLDECSKMDNQATGTLSDSEHRLQLPKTLDINDDDILAGLPEVRISGTLSNPPSPILSTSSDYKINVNKIQSRQMAIQIAPKKRRATQRSSRRTLIDRNASDEPFVIINKPNSSIICRSSPNSFSTNLDVDKVSARENNDRQTNKRSSRLSKATTVPESSRRSTEKDFLVQSEPMGKDAPVEKATAESTKVNVANASRIGKRSLSAIDTAVESGVVKKHKKNVTENAPVATKNRKRNAITVRRQSENILDFVARRSSPFDVNNSSNRSTPDDLSLESTTESSSNNKTRQNRRKSVTNIQTTPATSTKKNDKTVKKQKSTNQRETRKIDLQVEDISSQVGEESQEVEMIINGALKQQNLGSNIETKEDVKENSKGSRRQSIRKRGNTTGYTNTDTMESSASSTIYESEDTCFEMPISKAKRAKASKNTSNKARATKNESTEEPKGNSRLTRSTRGLQQSIIDSSVEESSIDQTTLNDTTSKTNNSRSKRQPQKRGNTKATKKQKQDILEETTSELNSSVESASILSTPNRSRKNMSSSFTTSSPLRIKHKILFTGISNNDYNKSLTKLGASQVEEPTKCSVLVTDKVRRTVKFLCALALSVPIVSVDWLVNSGMVGHFVDLDDYILEDPVAEAKFNFKLRDSLKKAKDHKLLEGYTIVVTPNVAPPPISELKSIITSCNGKMLVRPPQSWPKNAVIISQKEDMKNAKRFLAKAPKTVTIQSTEFILTGILRQKLDFTEFQLT